MHPLERLRPMLISLCARHTIAGYETDDLVQDCIFTCLARWHRYDPTRGSEATYAYTVARHHLIDLARAARRDPLTLAASMTDESVEGRVNAIPDPGNDPAAEVMEAAAHDALQAACAALLSPDDVLILHNQQDGVPDHVTARTLGIRREAVCRRRASILAHLRSHLDPEDYL